MRRNCHCLLNWKGNIVSIFLFNRWHSSTKFTFNDLLLIPCEYGHKTKIKNQKKTKNNILFNQITSTEAIMPLRRNKLLGVQRNEETLEGKGIQVLKRKLGINFYSYSKYGKECKPGDRPSYVLYWKKLITKENNKK